MQTRRAGGAALYRGKGAMSRHAAGRGPTPCAESLSSGTGGPWGDAQPGLCLGCGWPGKSARCRGKRPRHREAAGRVGPPLQGTTKNRPRSSPRVRSSPACSCNANLGFNPVQRKASSESDVCQHHTTRASLAFKLSRKCFDARSLGHLPGCPLHDAICGPNTTGCRSAGSGVGGGSCRAARTSC